MKKLAPASRMLLFCAFFLSLISWDRVSKDLAKEHLRNQPARSFLHNTIRLQYVENTGAALSLADHLPPRTSFWLLCILPLAGLLGLFDYLLWEGDDLRTVLLTAVTLIVSWGIGNIP